MPLSFDESAEHDHAAADDGGLRLLFGISRRPSDFHGNAAQLQASAQQQQPPVLIAPAPNSTTTLPLIPSASAGEMSLVLSRDNSHNQLRPSSSSQPGSRRMTGENQVQLQESAAMASRRASAVLATMRHQAMGMVAQRRLLLGLLHGQHAGSITSLRNLDDNSSINTQAPTPAEKSPQSRLRSRRKSSWLPRFTHDDTDEEAGGEHFSDAARQKRNDNRRAGDDDLTTVLSAFYAKLLVVLGIAFPVTGVLTNDHASGAFYQGFYLYLYVVSVLFVMYMYTAHLRTRALFSMLDSFQDDRRNSQVPLRKPVAKYGSFYLRVGAVAFGIGSMVYSGLEFGQYFELKGVAGCQNVLIALTPAARIILSIVQMQFIFLNTKEFEMSRHKVIARFGLMHMVATNLCEWLYVLVEETKHEIVHLQQGVSHNETLDDIIEPLQHDIVRRAATDAAQTVVECRRTNIMGRLVQNASPFLFPCTIEYSLICAVILFEMWKQVHDPRDNVRRHMRSAATADPHAHRPSAHQFSIDCSRAHRGMFAGILVIVLTIISLIMFFVLSAVPAYAVHGTLGVTVSEMILYVLTIVAVMVAYQKMRDLRFVRHLQKHGGGGSNSGGGHNEKGMPMDCTLLLLAQSGVFLYGMFSIIGSYMALSMEAGADGEPGGSGAAEAIVAEVFGLVQTCAQSIFILNSWYRRLDTPRQSREMPGRETVTFLLVANMAMWFVNTLAKGRASFRPTHLRIFGAWAWTIITHVSMPLAIFYRFHSTICLFEIWKTAYKVRPEMTTTAAAKKAASSSTSSKSQYGSNKTKASMSTSAAAPSGGLPLMLSPASASYPQQQQLMQQQQQQQQSIVVTPPTPTIEM